MSIYRGIREMLIKRFHEAKDSELFLKSLFNLTVPSKAFLELYKNLKPLESLEPEDRQDIIQTIENMFPERDEEFKARAQKVIYCFAKCIEI